MAGPDNEPRTYFLNEQHELRDEKSGRAGAPKFGAIDWADKGQRISHSLKAAKTALDRSPDPLHENRYYLVARPVVTVPKRRSKKGVESEEDVEPRFTKSESQIFGRLGIDLVNVTAAGDALVHATPDRLEQLATRTALLGAAGVREQSRWSTLDSFEPIPPQLRIDDAWLSTIRGDEPVEAIIQLQPLLTAVEVDSVMRAVAKVVVQQPQERILGNGSDLTGRQWMRGRVTRKTLVRLAHEFFSIELLHAPLTSITAARRRTSRKAVDRQQVSLTSPAAVERLPSVAVFDTGIPPAHLPLARYRRGEFVARPDLTTHRGSHGSLVASRVVFGDLDLWDGSTVDAQSGACRFVDVKCSDGIHDIDDKTVIDALPGVAGAYPDVRVFNFSFAAKSSLDQYGEVDRTAQLLQAEQLDNFIFERDLLITVAAGNSPSGVIPNPPYPKHLNDSRWKLGRWALGFNTLVCGSHIGSMSSKGLIRRIGLPSPFTRIGPGIAKAPTPSFSGTGGDIAEDYRTTEAGSSIGGLGVWCCDELGRWEDHSGTSFAVPLLAREAALALDHIQQTQPGVRPFAVTAKAFLALTANRPCNPDHLSKPERALCDRTLGFGVASSRRLQQPDVHKAIAVWQGILNDPIDVAVVDLPIPQDWLKQATHPRMRAVIAYDPPVNHAASEIWACRRVNAVLRPTPGGDAVKPKGRGHQSYPLIDRRYDLRDAAAAGPNRWQFEINYTEQNMAAYPATATFSPQQRIAVALELLDDSEQPINPHAFIQAMPNIASMNRLSHSVALTQLPMMLRSNV